MNQHDMDRFRIIFEEKEKEIEVIDWDESNETTSEEQNIKKLLEKQLEINLNESEKERIMKRFNLKGKSEAMSIQSIIVGSVLSAVIGTFGIAMLWPSVDKAKEENFIKDYQERIKDLATFRVMNGALISYTATNSLVSALDITEQLESDKNTKGITRKFVNINDGNKALNYYVLVFDYTNNEGVNLLKLVAPKLEKRFDGTANAGASSSVGKIQYGSSCAGSVSECYLAFRIDSGTSAQDRLDITSTDFNSVITKGTSSHSTTPLFLSTVNYFDNTEQITLGSTSYNINQELIN